MALQKNIASSTGLEISLAYIKIDEYSCDKKNNVRARVRAYVNKEMEQAGKDPIEGTEDIINIIGDYSTDASNIKRQVYEHMKTTEKYNDAEDVFEE